MLQERIEGIYLFLRVLLAILNLILLKLASLVLSVNKGLLYMHTITNLCLLSVFEQSFSKNEKPVFSRFR